MNNKTTNTNTNPTFDLHTSPEDSYYDPNLINPDLTINLDTVFEAAAGEYTLTLSNYTSVPAVLNQTQPDPNSDKNTSHLIDPSQSPNAIIRQPYILLETSNPLISIRLYAARVPYFMSAINRQYHYALNGYSLKQTLEYLFKHPFKTQLTYSSKYGAQYNFNS